MTDIPHHRRADFRLLRAVPTRWMDNDHYGHVNNVTYYSYFDTAVNGFLIEASGIDVRELPAIGIVAESSCLFAPGCGRGAQRLSPWLKRRDVRGEVHDVSISKVGDDGFHRKRIAPIARTALEIVELPCSSTRRMPCERREQIAHSL